MSAQLSTTAARILSYLTDPRRRRRRGWAFVPDLGSLLDLEEHELDRGLGELARLGLITIRPGRREVLVWAVGW